jgi:uncharacterized membrane-anchored protein
MKSIGEAALSKVPQVTLGSWIIKIAATTLGETGGDALSMTMNLGYVVSSAIFFAFFIVTVVQSDHLEIIPSVSVLGCHHGHHHA